MDSETTLGRVDVDGAIREMAHEASEALGTGADRFVGVPPRHRSPQLKKRREPCPI